MIALFVCHISGSSYIPRISAPGFFLTVVFQSRVCGLGQTSLRRLEIARSDGDSRTHRKDGAGNPPKHAQQEPNYSVRQRRFL